MSKIDVEVRGLSKLDGYEVLSELDRYTVLIDGYALGRGLPAPLFEFSRDELEALWLALGEHVGVSPKIGIDPIDGAVRHCVGEVKAEGYRVAMPADRRKPPTGEHAEYRDIGNEPAPASCRTCVHWYRGHGACVANGVLYVRRKGDNCAKYEEGKSDASKGYEAAMDKAFAATVKPARGRCVWVDEEVPEHMMRIAKDAASHNVHIRRMDSIEKRMEALENIARKSSDAVTMHLLNDAFAPKKEPAT